MKIAREFVSIDEMQFGLVPCKGTTDAIFILWQLQEKHYFSQRIESVFAFRGLQRFLIMSLMTSYGGQ